MTRQLHNYQLYAVDQIIKNPYVGLFLDMGLGKTVSTLEALHRLRDDCFEDLGKILIIAPLRPALDVWPVEIRKWGYGFSVSRVIGTAPQRIKALQAEADIYIVNRECVSWLVGHLGKFWGFETVVIDESSSFKNYQSQRFRALKRVRPKLKRVVILTGTPRPNGLIDIWSQIYLLDQGQRLGTGIGQYRDRYFRPGQRYGQIVYNWQIKRDGEERIYKEISDIVFSMRSQDYLKLPELTEIDKAVLLDAEGRKLYDRLERELLIPYRDADVVAMTAAALSGKLLQMASGAVYDTDRGIKLIHGAKLDALETIVEEANGKPVMVFYNYQHSLARLKDRFPQAQTLRKGKDGSADVAAWNNNEIPILLIHPKSAGHGLNLQYGDCQHLIWYDNTWSLEENQQAIARVYRQGQDKPVIVIRLVADQTIDVDVVSAIRNKSAGQEALLSAVRARINQTR